MLPMRLFYAALCLVGCLAEGLSAVGQQTGASASDALTVITYNIRYASPNDGPDVWPNRVDAVAEVIAGGDIVGLQEVTFAQLTDLTQRLDGYDHYGVGRDDGKRSGEYSPIFYRAERFDLVSKGTFWLSETPEQVGSKGWDAALPRVCSWLILRDVRSGDQMWIANTHFDHRGERARAESGRLIVEMASQHRRLPMIVMGDFNCLPGSEPYQALVAQRGEVALLDTRKLTKPLGPSSTWCGFRAIEPGRIIDHIFVSETVDLQQLKTLDPKTAAGRFASDHLPVRVRVAVGHTTPDSAP